MARKLIDLFEGLMAGSIPFGGGGYILSVLFHEKSDYTIFEIIGFNNVKNIIPAGDSVTFQSDGYKIYMLYEPMTYTMKTMEPYLREQGKKIPMRWSEVEVLQLPTKDNFFVSKEPYISFGAFTVEKPAEGSFVYYVYENEEMDDTILAVVEKILHGDFRVPKTQMDRIKELLISNLARFHKQADPEA